MKRTAKRNTIGYHTLIAVSNFDKNVEKFFQNCLYKYHKSSNILIYSLDDPCELYCTDSEDTIIVPWGDSAEDGTPCNIGTNDMCISGICRVSLKFNPCF